MDSPEMSPQHEQPKGSCFPVSEQAIARASSELRLSPAGKPDHLLSEGEKEKREVEKGGLWERFVEKEKAEIAKDENLKDFLDTAYGWYHDETRSGDRNAFLDGASFVHRALREQGVVPRIQEDTSEALKKEDRSYQDIANRGSGTVADLLSTLDESSFSRIRELTDGWDQKLGQKLKEEAKGRRSKSSFVFGAEMMYSVLKDADLRNMALETEMNGDVDLDAELAEITKPS